MMLNYPTNKDAQRGFKNDLINKREEEEIIQANNNGSIPPQNTKLGSGVGIHGGGFNVFGNPNLTWTRGCVGLYDSDAEELYEAVKIGTPVEILPDHRPR